MARSSPPISGCWTDTSKDRASECEPSARKAKQEDDDH